MAEISASPAHRAFVAEYLRAKPAQMPFTLRPIAALSEVVAVCETVRAGHQPPQPHDRRTLAHDVMQALKSLGPSLSGMLEPDLQDYLQDLKELSKDLEDGGASLRLLHTTRMLRQRLCRSECAQAAWRDLVEAVCVSGPDPDRDRLHVLQIREIDEALGNQWEWRRTHLRMKVREGFEQAERLLSLADHPVQVVWFVFANAGLADGYLRVGQIQFFSRRLWSDLGDRPDALARWPEAQFPAELNPYMRHQMSVGDLPADADPAPSTEDAGRPAEQQSAGHYVYARVELDGPHAQGRYNPQAHGRAPVEWARDLVLGVVEAATFRRGGSTWRLMHGEAVYHGDLDPPPSPASTPDDTGHSTAQGPASVIEPDSGLNSESAPDWNWSYALPFGDPARGDAMTPYEVLRDGTGRALESLPAGYAAALARGEPAAQAAAAEVRWHQATRRQVDAAQRVVLYVRAFEQSLPLRGGEHWDRAVDHFLRQRWALERFLGELRATASHDDWLVSRVKGDERAYEAFGPYTRQDSGPLDMPAFLRSTAQVAAAIPRTWPLARMQAKTADRWVRDPLTARKRLQELEQRFGLLLVRALRQRNAVVHGTRTVPAVVVTVDGFLESLSAFIVDDAIHAVDTGQDLPEVLEHRRARARRTLWRLEQDGADTIEILYGPAS